MTTKFLTRLISELDCNGARFAFLRPIARVNEDAEVPPTYDRRWQEDWVGKIS